MIKNVRGIFQETARCGQSVFTLVKPRPCAHASFRRTIHEIRSRLSPFSVSGVSGPIEGL